LTPRLRPLLEEGREGAFGPYGDDVAVVEPDAFEDEFSCAQVRMVRPGRGAAPPQHTARRPLRPQVTLTVDDPVRGEIRTLPLPVSVLSSHPGLPLRPSIFAVTVEPAPQARFRLASIQMA